MTELHSTAAVGHRNRSISSGTVILLAAACAVVTSGSYFARPLIGIIGPEIGLAPWMAGIVIAVCQLGFVGGLLFVAPLADILENRRLLMALFAASVLALAGASVATRAPEFMIACFGIGAASTAVQLLVAMAAHLSAPARRGQTVGLVTSGLLVGLLLAWPVANMVNAVIGWRALYRADAVITAILGVVLIMMLPRRPPVDRGHGYREVIASLWGLLHATAELRQRALSQALLFASFSLFWAAVAGELRTQYGLEAPAIALFGLAGASGALVAPLAGRMADHGRSVAAARAGTLCVIAGLLIAIFADHLWLLLLAAILLDAGVQTNHVISQRAVLSIDAHASNRLNSLYIATFFAAGAIGSALASPIVIAGGWRAVAITGVLISGLALRVGVGGRRSTKGLSGS